MSYRLHLGDCLEVLLTLQANSIDTVITDPPSGISFMGKSWDNHSKYTPRTDKGHRTLGALTLLELQPWEAGFVAFIADWCTEALRVLKPGAMALVWALPRTSDLTVLGMRLAGFEIRDNIYHIFGSGFPKSANISKLIDAAAGVEREVIGKNPHSSPGRKPGVLHIAGGNQRPAMERRMIDAGIDKTPITAPATDAAKEWDGYGSGLKPAAEEWVLAMKPLDKNFAQNALKWGVAGLNIAETRISNRGKRPLIQSNRRNGNNTYGDGLCGSYHAGETTQGRWPANLILDEHAAGLLDEQSGELTSGGKQPGVYQHSGKRGGIMGETVPRTQANNFEPSAGGASRFFTVLPDDECRFRYVAKSSTSERNEGLEELPPKPSSKQFMSGVKDTGNNVDDSIRQFSDPVARNFHPTIKPLSLMKWLVRLTRTPKGGTVLDPFMGSATTGVACMLERRQFVGIEMSPEYFAIAQARMEHWQDEADMTPIRVQGAVSDYAEMPLFAEVTP